jgi:hypothetical protein
MEVTGQFHTPSALLPGERAPDTHWIRGWVGPRAGLDDVEKRKFLLLLEIHLKKGKALASEIGKGL